MKKFYVTLVAFLIATMSFAQVESLPFSKQEVKKTDGEIQKLIPFHQNSTKGSAASWWFSYFPEFFKISEGIGSLEWEMLPMNCDTNAQIHFTGGDNTVQFNGLGQIFNFDEIFWRKTVQTWYSADQTSIPDMTSATIYSIDSVGIEYAYGRGSAQDASVVDTIIISVLADLTEANLDYRLNAGAFVVSLIQYDTSNFVLKEIPGTKREVIKVPLTVSDSTTFVEDGTHYIAPIRYNVAVPGLTNLTNKNMVIFYTFKPGIPTNHNQFIKVDFGDFRGLTYKDPRSAYGQDSTVEVVNERNNSIHAFAGTFNNRWPKLLPHLNLFWDGIMRPALFAYSSCDDCSMGSIKEMAKKNVTIYPNPATDNFTVTLDATGKSNIEMFNLVGQKVYSKVTSDATVTVNVNNFKSGVYMLRINQNGQVYTSKVVVK
ncbi:MAG: T9SS type A sorting domain-containing protein [Bacteroidales bacterium]|jgi:hypothetical protein|nr:T9SS type A sorting domain-containing protein [Bacteroidales bacterium]